MKQLLAALAFLALVLLACTTPSDVRVRPVHVAPSASARPVLVDRTFGDDIPAIVGAVEAWNYTLQGQLVLRPEASDLTIPELQDPHAVLIMRVDSRTCTFIPHTRQLEEGPERLPLAWTERIGGRKVWVLRDLLTPELVRPIVMHEIGHVLGADDHVEPGLMRWTFARNEYRCIDRASALEVVRALGLRDDRLAYCVAP